MAIVELGNMRLLLTNDDGVDAPGLQAMREATAGLGPCCVVAPQGPASGCGHQVTTHAPIQVSRRTPDCFTVAGTPVDCVRLALHALATDADWIISGINAGGNLGTDIYHSGTVAAVREAAIRGRPGIAISHFIARGRAIDWPWAASQARRVLRHILARPWVPGTFWNVNLPHLGAAHPDPEIVFCPLDPSPLPAEYLLEGDLATYTGVYQSRERRPGRDIEVCFGGRIAVTRVALDGREGSLAEAADANSGGIALAGTDP